MTIEELSQQCDQVIFCAAGKQKRGGRKKKGKKRKANEHQKPRNLRVDTEAKVQCKYFLDGKCNKVTELRLVQNQHFYIYL